MHKKAHHSSNDDDQENRVTNCLNQEATHMALRNQQLLFDFSPTIQIFQNSDPLETARD
jgi:hypothetical protein